jgi:putative glutamine amidotransferase
MSAPIIAVTTWRRSLSTYLGAATDLYTLGAEYADAVRAAGGIPLLVPALTADEVSDVLDRVDAVLLSGGQDLGLETEADAERDATEFAILAGARERGLPVFGICRGLQAINVFLGGTLVDDVPATSAHPLLGADADQAASRHTITASADWVAESLPEGGIVNSIHHQAIDELAPGLEAVAWAEDRTIEAVQAFESTEGTGGTNDRWFVHAVQWHPEKLPGVAGRRHSTQLLAGFISAARLSKETERSRTEPARI